MDEADSTDRPFASDDYPDEITATYRHDDAPIVSTGPAKWLLRFEGEDLAWGRGFATFTLPGNGMELCLGERLPPQEMPADDGRLPTAIMARPGDDWFGIGTATGRVWLAEDREEGTIDTIDVEAGEWRYWFVDEDGRLLGEDAESVLDTEPGTGGVSRSVEDAISEVRKKATKQLEKRTSNDSGVDFGLLPGDRSISGGGPDSAAANAGVTRPTPSPGVATDTEPPDFGDAPSPGGEVRHVSEREPTEYEERRGLREDTYQILDAHEQNGRFLGYLVSRLASDSRSWVSRSNVVNAVSAVVEGGGVVEIAWDVVADDDGTVTVGGDDFGVWFESWTPGDIPLRHPEPTGPVPFLSIGNWVESAHVFEGGKTWTRAATDEAETDTEAIDWWELL